MDVRNILSNNNVQSGLSSIAGGMLNNSGEPYKKAGEVYNQSQNQGINYESPFYQYGAMNLPALQSWLTSMQNPSGFINNLMKHYQESPWAKFETSQGTRAANNAASASGLIGSTPLAQETAKYAEDITSQDMQNWLSKVLGINTEYGAGESGLVGMGQNSANSILSLISNLAQPKGEAAYGQSAGQNQDRSDLIAGIIKLLS